jgi:protoporphyrin/coproporphyrin ferrochelatase
MNYDALLVVAFGGPEGPDEVMPFLENVLRGRNVPRERMLEVAEHYHHFGGVSPINAQVRALIAALEPELRAHGIDLPIYWGNRNWHPLLPDTLQAMTADGVRRGLAFFVSAYSSYSGCRQYRENVIAAREAVGPTAPEIDKLRAFYNHPDFVAANADRLRDALKQLPENARGAAEIAFTAHSIPSSMAASSNYEQQLTETARLVAEACDIDKDRWRLVYQSRSGRPEDPWLGPDIVDYLGELKERGTSAVVVAPIGFLSDHMEVLYDLDAEAADAAKELGLPFARAGTVGTHPRFITMIRKLIQERLSENAPREAIGQYGPNWDTCPVDCCPAPLRPQAGGQTPLSPPPSPQAS